MQRAPARAGRFCPGRSLFNFFLKALYCKQFCLFSVDFWGGGNERESGVGILQILLPFEASTLSLISKMKEPSAALLLPTGEPFVETRRTEHCRVGALHSTLWMDWPSRLLDDHTIVLGPVVYHQVPSEKRMEQQQMEPGCKTAANTTSSCGPASQPVYRILTLC